MAPPVLESLSKSCPSFFFQYKIGMERKLRNGSSSFGSFGISLWTRSLLSILECATNLLKPIKKSIFIQAVKLIKLANYLVASSLSSQFFFMAFQRAVDCIKQGLHEIIESCLQVQDKISTTAAGEVEKPPKLGQLQSFSTILMVGSMFRLK